jgi:signal peptidase
VVAGARSVVGAGQRFVANLLGTGLLLGPTGLAYLAFATSLGYYVLGWIRESGRDDRERSRQRETEDHGVDRLLVAFALVLVVGATLAMAVPGGSQEYAVLSTESDVRGETAIRIGESQQRQVPLSNGGPVPVVVYLEPAGDGIDVSPHRVSLGGGGRTNATVTLHAPPETGYYRRYLVEHRYLALLPHGVLDALYRLHPWAPIVAIDALLGGGFYLLGVVLVGRGPVRSRETDRPSRVESVYSKFT